MPRREIDQEPVVGDFELTEIHALALRQHNADDWQASLAIGQL